MFENEFGTRTSYASNLAFSWSLGDTLGIYPIGADQVSFPISSGDGSKSANFDGGAWALRSSYQYAGYFPFSAKNYHNSIDAIPFSFEGQTQNGNNGMTHLGKYDYMASAATAPTASGSVSLQMKRLGCFMRLSLTVPTPSTLTSVTVESAGVKFGTEGTIDLSAATPQLNVTKTSSSITMALTNVTTTRANQNVLLWILTAPVDMSAETLTVSVTSRNGGYRGEVPGKNMVANGGYGYTVALSDAYNGHEYVDLGLPSGLKWATCNIGAENPEDYGDYNSWGEIDSEERKLGFSPYNWVFYDYNTDSYNVPSKDISGTQYDAARQKWGELWRIPTRSEFQELVDNCSWTWTVVNGKNGYKIQNKNDKNGDWIFLPAAGYRLQREPPHTGTEGYYWTSNFKGGYGLEDYAYYFIIYQKNNIHNETAGEGYKGFSIRPVSK